MKLAGTVNVYLLFKLFSGLLYKGRWITCDFTSFSTVFMSYQEDERLITKGCVQWSSVYALEDALQGQRLLQWEKILSFQSRRRRDGDSIVASPDGVPF